MTSRGSELFTVEQSHGKARVTGPRLSNLGTVDTEGERQQNHLPNGWFAPGNRVAADRSAKRALTAPLRAATARVRLATEASPARAVDELLANAMAVYASSRRELGTRSTLVLSSLAVHATESVLAGYYIQRAAEVGLETTEGARLVELAHSCEQQAARAMTAALAASKVLADRKGSAGRGAKSVVARIEREAERIMQTSGESADGGET